MNDSVARLSSRIMGTAAAVFLIAQLVFLCSCGTRHLVQQETKGKVAEIVERGTILIGTTGDYRPLSFCEEDGTYWGFGIEVAKEIARRMGVGVEFKKTSWPTLTADVLAEPQRFDLAIGGITITDTHSEIGVLMRKGQEDLLELVNATIRQMKSDGSLRKLHEKYGLVYEITFLM